MKYDAIIIGTGQAGPPLALSLAKKGKKVAIIEKNHLGGTCVNTGCTPTKTYIASARRVFVARNSEELGVGIEGKVKVNLKQIKRRKDDLIQESRDSWEKSFSEEPGISLIRGKAKFIDSKSIEVDGKIFSAETIYINVGARPRIPEGFENVPVLTNETMLELEEIPEHLIIVGGGYVGLEFAQMFRRFGSKVTILERGERLMKKEDEDISEAIAEILKKEDIHIRFKSECISAKPAGEGVEIQLECETGEPSIKGSHLLMATGRIPNTDELGLDAAEIKTDKKGYIQVNERLQTNMDHIFALGDCNGEGAFTHTSYNDFQIVDSHLQGTEKKYLSDRISCYAAYIDPSLARVGMNLEEIREKGLKANIAIKPMKEIARAKEMGETDGLLKIYTEEGTDKILGASFLGTRADEYIHAIIDVMYADAPYTVIKNAVHIHPTVSELIPTMLQNLKPVK
ncbi:mercuric reductase [Salinimicrobium marinum]|uniref:Mercuric reductase n=1 Tax=Salinimicrobium marinum TaxID=680283 RepID=A0A918W2C5_9FLAO|nr:FAD-containing oxidoreductase [Salinimicrobium marinum]GHA48356.1 mercuric reductase [Salinimicrobium marinum]